MKKGRVTITMPSGEIITLGNGRRKYFGQLSTITDKRFFEKCVLFGDVGFGEAYTDGLLAHR